MKHWLKFETATAPTPHNRNESMNVGISPEIPLTFNDTGRRTLIFQIWCHVFGELPPINNIAKVENSPEPPTLLTLKDSKACFRGIERPHDNEENGESVLIYVLKPKVSVEYSPSMVCLAQPVTVPSNLVITVQVRQNFTLQSHNAGISSWVTRFEPILSAQDDNNLPLRYDSRYAERLW